MENWAMEIRFRAERGFGQLLKDTAEKKERRGRGGDVKSNSRQREIDPPKQFKDLGISMNQSSQYQQMATIPDDEFEVRLTHAKHDPRSASTQKMLKPVPELFEEPELWKRVDI
jgi:hypothetical protein